MTIDSTQPPEPVDDVEPLPLDETRHHFSETLDGIKLGMVQMGSLVTENVRRAGDVMLEGRLDLAPVVIEHDREVNRLYAELEQLTFETLARQQPVAGDLRFLVSTTRILYEIERSGDLAVNCVNVAQREHGLPQSPKLTALLNQMVSECCSLFAAGVDALADMDPVAGAALDAKDDVLDDLVGRYYTEIGRVSEEIGLETAIQLSKVGRFLERIGDHAVNVGENVAYVITAKFPGDTHAGVAEYE